jgi:hypothetical protein
VRESDDLGTSRPLIAHMMSKYKVSASFTAEAWEPAIPADCHPY